MNGAPGHRFYCEVECGICTDPKRKGRGLARGSLPTTAIVKSRAKDVRGGGQAC